MRHEGLQNVDRTVEERRRGSYFDSSVMCTPVMDKRWRVEIVKEASVVLVQPVILVEVVFERAYTMVVR